VQEASTALTARTARALTWRLATRTAAFGLRLAVLVAFARLVGVEAFGLLNQAMIVMGLAAVASEFGMASAVIQARNLTKTHIRVAFTISVLSGTLLTLVVYLAAPVAAWLFREPAVIPVLRLVCFVFLGTALGTTAGALLQRNLAFRALFVIEFGSYALGYAGVGIGLALAGYGIWALAWAPVVEALLRALFLYAACRHPVRPSLAPTAAAQLVRYGTGLTLARVANYVALNGDNAIVGRNLGVAALGLYGRAYQLMTLPMSELSEVVGTVLFPAYAEIQDQPERFRKASLAVVSLSAMLVFPLLAGLAITAPELVAGAFGEPWRGAILPLQVLCAGGFFRCIYSLGDSVARARGAVYSQAWRHAVYALCVLAAASIGCIWGLVGVAVGVNLALGIMYLLMAHLNVRLTGASWREFFWCQVPGTALAAAVVVAAAPTAVLLRGLECSPFLVLAGTMAAGGMAAGLVGLVWPRNWLQSEVRSVGERLGARLIVRRPPVRNKALPATLSA
jgi:O-antigen/teichoic acid export membrane protein